LTSGNQNYGIGTYAVTNCTSGYNNFGFGSQALYYMTTGHDNVAIGPGALYQSRTDQGNFAIGVNALATLNGGSNNTAMGNNSGSTATNASYNIFVGNSSGGGIVSGGNNILIGYQAGASYNDNSSVLIGNQTGFHLVSGSGNVLIGKSCGYSLAAGSYYNTMIGSETGLNLNSSSSGNTWIGAYAHGPSAAAVNTILLSNASLATNGYFVGLDMGLTASNVWSFFNGNPSPVGLHVYKTTDSAYPPINYERGCLDWNLTSNVFRLASQAGGTGTVRLLAIDGFQKAGAPAATDLPAGTMALINDTSGGQTWLAYNAAGTIRKVQLT
jgi:hypothetical protein